MGRRPAVCVARDFPSLPKAQVRQWARHIIRSLAQNKKGQTQNKTNTNTTKPHTQRPSRRGAYMQPEGRHTKFQSSRDRRSACFLACITHRETTPRPSPTNIWGDVPHVCVLTKAFQIQGIAGPNIHAQVVAECLDVLFEAIAGHDVLQPLVDQLSHVLDHRVALLQKHVGTAVYFFPPLGSSTAGARTGGRR